MRVALVGPVPPLRGGIAHHTARLAEAMQRAGHDVLVESWKAQYPRRLFPGGDQVDGQAKPPPGARFHLRWWSPLSWWRAGREARGRDLLVFAWVTSFHALPYRVLLAAASPTPTVAMIHNVIPHERQPFDTKLAAWVLGRARGAVAHAASVAEDLRSIAPHVPVEVIPLPPNLPLEAAQLPPAPPFRLLFFGFVRPYKGLDVALETVAELLRRGVPVVMTVAGEFWEPLARWQQAVAAAGLDRQVTLRPGYVSDAETQELFDSHHLLLAPYHHATQSATVPLALAAGRPVVVTEVGGLKEAVSEGLNGALAPPGDSKLLADAVERVLHHLPEMSVAARASAPSWDQVVQALLRQGR